MELLFLVCAFTSAFLITYLSIPAIIKVANEKHLYDEPDEDRKKHRDNIPTLGGVAIFGGLVIATTFFADFKEFPKLGYILSATVILFFTGMKDDIIPLTPKKKLIAQVLASLIIVIRCDIRFTNFYGLFWIDDISYPVSVIISIFTLLVITNAFNLIDGINGLAGGIGFITCSTFGYLFYLMNEINLSIVALALGGALLAFLRYNMTKHADIFMGDTGALIIGLISAVFCIEFIELNRADAFVFKTTFAPVFAGAILIIPLFDTLRVFIIRLAHGKSPFSGDRNHLHHLLIDTGLLHWQASLLLYIINIFFIAFALFFTEVSQIFSVIVLLATACLLSLLLFQLKLRKEEADRQLAINGNKKKIQQVKVEPAEKLLEGELK